MKLFLKISYLGTAYSGYQAQKNGVSVQQMLNQATAKLFGHECDICGCSRTDKGVHANEFCLTVCERGKDYLSTTITTDSIVRALNIYLPDDISVLCAEWRESDFHARYCVKSKEYIYRIYNAPTRSPFECGRALHYPKPIDDSTFARMRCAAELLEGTHDFTSFMASGSKITDCKRTVYKTELLRQGDAICFAISADGFLYNMVRIIVGTLLEVAEGKKDPEDILKILGARNRAMAGRTAPADGLYLNQVIY